MSSRAHFSVTDGNLRVDRQDAESWTGLPDGVSVLDLRVAGDGSSAFVLLDPPPRGGRVRNLVRVTSTAEIAWRGELPKTSRADAFVSLETDVDGYVLASTWTGYRVRLDPATGCLLGQEFTK